MSLLTFIREECLKDELIKNAVENCNDNQADKEVLLTFIKNNINNYDHNMDVDLNSFEFKLAAFYQKGGQFGELIDLWVKDGISYNFDFEKIEIDYDSIDEKELLSQVFYQEHFGASIFDQMIHDKTVNEVGFTDGYYYVWSEKKIRIPYWRDTKYQKSIMLRLSQNRDKQGLSESNPSISFTRKDGTRVSAFIPPFTKQYNLSIRIFNKKGESFKGLHESNITNELIKFFVKSKAKIVFQGELGIGKTTTMQSIYQLIPDDLHIATIEDSFEQNNGLLYPEKRILEFQTLKNMDYFDAIQMILRSSVDFANVGEVRSPSSAKAVIDLSMAVSKAMYFTFHVTAPKHTIPRLVNLLMMTGFYKNETSAAIDIISSVDYIIQHGWVNGKRDIISITEINEVDYEQLSADNLDDSETLEKLYFLNQIQQNYRNRYELRTIYEHSKGIVNRPRRVEKEGVEHEIIFDKILSI